MYIWSPASSIPAIATITVTPEISTERPGGGGGGLERGPVTAAGRPLLTLALDVEERVVDADGEADQQDDRADVLVHRDELARQREQADRGGHAP